MGKQPWEMTLEEFTSLVPAPRKIREGLWRVEMVTSQKKSVGSSTSIAYPDEQTARLKAPRALHWHFIFDAIYRGDSVPENILVSYPDLWQEHERRKQRMEARAKVVGPALVAAGSKQTNPRLTR
jgi:hypothetical protein